MTILAGVWRIAQGWAPGEEEAPVRLKKMDSWTGMLWWRASDYGHISKIILPVSFFFLFNFLKSPKPHTVKEHIKEVRKSQI